MFIPVRDINQLRHIKFQHVTISLILINVMVFWLQFTATGQEIAASFALIPREVFAGGFVGGGTGPYDKIAVPEVATLLTFNFLHGDILHLATNMMFLWVFGDNVEDALGHARFALFYVLCGITAGLFHAIALPSSGLPLIGASGAVSGIIGAYLLLYPRVHIWVLALRIIPLKLTAAVFLGLWLASQLGMLLFAPPSRVAFTAHVGGFIAGALLVLIMRRPGVGLFEKTLPPPPLS